MLKKCLIFVCFTIVVLYIFHEKGSNEIEIKNGVAYEKNTLNKYTGKIVDKYSLFGQIKYIGEFKEGNPIGTHQKYYENGEIQSKKIYDDKKRLTLVQNFKKGKIKHGFYRENGWDGLYYNGEEIGFWKRLEYNALEKTKVERIIFVEKTPHRDQYYTDIGTPFALNYMLENNYITKYFYDDGQVRDKEITLQNSERIFTKYYKNGIISESNDNKIEKLYYENGNIRMEVVFSKDNYSQINEYYENENLSAINKNDKSGFTRIAFFESGEVKYIYKNDQKTIPTENIKSYYENGQLKYEINFVDQNLSGEFKIYYKNGNLKLKGNTLKVPFEKIIASYLDSKYRVLYFSSPGMVEYKKIEFLESLTSNITFIDSFLQSGNFLEEAYKNNSLELEGPVFSYHENGQLKEELLYVNNRKDGIFNSYYSDGELKVNGKYLKGNRVGIWTDYWLVTEKIIYSNYDESPMKQSKIPLDKNDYIKTKSNIITKNGMITQSVNYPDGSLRFLTVFNLEKKEVSITEYYKNGNQCANWILYGRDWEKLLHEITATGTLEFYEKENSSKDNFSNEIVKKYNANGKISVEYSVTNNREYGSSKKYGINGNLKLEKQYDNGTLLSTKEYYSDGKLKKTQYYKNGNSDGYWRTYTPKGKLKSEIFYKDGIKDGLERTFYNNQQLKSEIVFKDGKIISPFKGYYKNGKLKVLINYSNGPYYRYYENGQLKEIGNYEKGLLNGEVKVFYENGAVEKIVGYKNGKYHGKFQYYSENNELLFEQNYDEGVVSGIRKIFHLNLKLKAEGNIKNNKHEGPWKFFYDNGILGLEGNFENGVQVGEWHFYSSKGKLIQTINYNEFKDSLF